MAMMMMMMMVMMMMVMMEMMNEVVGDNDDILNKNTRRSNARMHARARTW